MTSHVAATIAFEMLCTFTKTSKLRFNYIFLKRSFIFIGLRGMIALVVPV